MTVMESESGFEGWAILELMGHRRLGGRISEATIAGGAFLRIDIPHPNETGIFTASQFYAPGAVYAITPTTEEIACAIACGAPDPVSRWDLRSLEASTGDVQTGDIVDAEVFDDGVPFDDESSF
jgi:hypothetical protein